MRREHGQAGVELLAVMPLLVLLVVVGLQALAWARAGVAAEEAATAGARALARGDDASAAARGALPAGARAAARVRVREGTVRVEVVVEPLVPLLPNVSVSAAA